MRALVGGVLAVVGTIASMAGLPFAWVGMNQPAAAIATTTAPTTPPTPAPLPARVTRAGTGELFEAEVAGVRRWYHLAGVTAPAYAPFDSWASQVFADDVEGPTWLAPADPDHPVDRKGRPLVALLYGKERQDAAEDLVGAGLARVRTDEPHLPNLSHLKAAERDARARGIGVWFQ